MKLLHMYICAAGWLETPAMRYECVYVYWLGLHTFEELVKMEDVTKYPIVPIGTNPFI